MFNNPKRVTINGGTEVDAKTNKPVFAKRFIYLTIDSSTDTQIKVFP